MLHSSTKGFSLFFLPVFLVLSLLSANRALSQISEDTTHWNDEELYAEDAAATPVYFSVGGGALFTYFKPDFAALNANIAQKFVRKNLDEQVIMVGGQGFVTVPFIPNFRIGGLGTGGRSAQCCYDTVVQGQAVSRTLEYAIAYGGISLDYVLPLNISKHFNIVPGVVLGLGSVNLYARQAAGRSAFNIDQEFNSPYNTTHTYTSNFFVYNPQIQFELAPFTTTRSLLSLLMFRAYVGYQGTSMGVWKVDRDVELGDTSPLNDVNGNGLVAGLGVFLGLFQ